MNKAIQRLACTRQVLIEREADATEANAALIASAEWQWLEQRKEYLKTARADVAGAETEVRKEAMKVFTKTDNRIPHPAVKIKDYTTIDYDDDSALDYAREHLPKALKINTRTFEKAAKVLELDFVTITQEPRATIARDLSKYLPEDSTT